MVYYLKMGWKKWRSGYCGVDNGVEAVRCDSKESASEYDPNLRRKRQSKLNSKTPDAFASGVTVCQKSPPKKDVIANQSADWCGNLRIRGKIYRLSTINV